MMGIPASGKSIELVSPNIGRVRDGRAAEHWADQSMFQFLSQIGAIPASGRHRLTAGFLVDAAVAHDVHQVAHAGGLASTIRKRLVDERGSGGRPARRPRRLSWPTPPRTQRRRPGAPCTIGPGSRWVGAPLEVTSGRAPARGRSALPPGGGRNEAEHAEPRPGRGGQRVEAAVGLDHAELAVDDATELLALAVAVRCSGERRLSPSRRGAGGAPGERTVRKARSPRPGPPAGSAARIRLQGSGVGDGRAGAGVVRRARAASPIGNDPGRRRRDAGHEQRPRRPPSSSQRGRRRARWSRSKELAAELAVDAQIAHAVSSKVRDRRRRPRDTRARAVGSVTLSRDAIPG